MYVLLFKGAINSSMSDALASNEKLTCLMVVFGVSFLNNQFSNSIPTVLSFASF